MKMHLLAKKLSVCQMLSQQQLLRYSLDNFPARLANQQRMRLFHSTKQSTKHATTDSNTDELVVTFSNTYQAVNSESLLRTANGPFIPKINLVGGTSPPDPLFILYLPTLATYPLNAIHSSSPREDFAKNEPCIQSLQGLLPGSTATAPKSIRL